MTWLFNEPSDFAKEMISGFVSANNELIRQVPGGVIRNTRSKPASVAVVIGGGSGHYPAFAGLVGQGLADGAAMGNLFASPSAQQICSVARAANKGGGILLAFGNYAGDLLHFSLARERLMAEGIPCETIAVTDDVSSASVSEQQKRRGVAGGLVVFKVASAAAEQGYSLKQVLTVAQMANACTRSIGVAFSGCTLPGAEQPLFTIPPGKIEFGMGIHGEPGIREIDYPSAKQLADMLISQLLPEAPWSISELRDVRLGVIVNGLGSVKYEELFVLWHNLKEILTGYGVQIFDSLVGEFITSFDMAGLSLTLFWLNDELEALWQQPAWTPAFRKGGQLVTEPLPESLQIKNETFYIPTASAVSRHTAKIVSDIFDQLTAAIANHAEELGRIDAVAGDGDHGIGMQRGISAAQQSAHQLLQQNAGVGTLLQRAADAWADNAGGTSGAIWGVILHTIGTSLGDQDAIDGRVLALAISRCCEGVMHFGKAKPGDKTLVDVLLPFSQQFTSAIERGVSLAAAWNEAAVVAKHSADETAHMRAKIGRARPLAERSLGTPDAGAVSLAMLLATTGQYLAVHCTNTQ